MAVQRFVKQIITPEKTIFYNATLEKLQPISENICVCEKYLDICSVI